MAVYNFSGSEINHVYGLNGAELSEAYDYHGETIFTLWESEITITKSRASDGSAYHFVTIPKRRGTGEEQYPFVFVPNGAQTGAYSALDVANEFGFPAVINAGVFHAATKTNDGVTIENSEILLNTPSTEHSSNPQAARPLTIDQSGNLGYAEYDADANDLLNSGTVSCISGFMPIVVNSEIMTDWINLWPTWATNDAQRQIFGCIGTDTYGILTIEGRDFDSSPGLTVTEAAELSVSLGFTFAYMLDGGGSTETVINFEQLNVVYEGTTGRKVPSFIVFNGTDNFMRSMP